MGLDGRAQRTGWFLVCERLLELRHLWVFLRVLGSSLSLAFTSIYRQVISPFYLLFSSSPPSPRDFFYDYRTVSLFLPLLPPSRRVVASELPCSAVRSFALVLDAVSLRWARRSPLLG